MIRRCNDRDLPAMLEIINDAATAYRGVIPADCYHDPYMTAEQLSQEIGAGVNFRGFVKNDSLVGVMGVQDVRDVTLIRHAYVRTAARRQGIGGRLLGQILAATDKPVLIGTWAAANWAIDFYRQHGFDVVTKDQSPILLRRYWTVSERQIETSVVLAHRAARPSA